MSRLLISRRWLVLKEKANPRTASFFFNKDYCKFSVERVKEKMTGGKAGITSENCEKYLNGSYEYNLINTSPANIKKTNRGFDKFHK